MRAYADKLYRSASSVLPIHHHSQYQDTTVMDPNRTAAYEPAVTSAVPGAGIQSANDSHKQQISDPVPTVTIAAPQLGEIPLNGHPSGADMLDTFRTHLGIYTSDDLQPNPSRPAPNMGIYQRVVIAEREAGRSYKLFSFLINGALGLQIIFAAALTALGAGSGSHIAVTAFGALNTVLAGFLTFLKGSGLPNRLKFYENEWSKVREYVEQRERDFAIQKRGVVTLDLGREISTIEQMYEHVRKDIEANTPDSYISLSRHMGGGRNTESAPIPARQFQGDPISGIRNHAREVAPSLARQYTDFAGKAQSRFADLESAARSRFTDAQHDLEKRFADTQANVEHRFQDTQQQAQSRMQGYRSDAEKGYADIEHGVQDTQGRAQTRMHDLESGLQNRYTGAQLAAQQSYQDARGQVQQTENSLQAERAGLERQYTDTRAGVERQFTGTHTAAEHGLTNPADQARSRLHEAETNAKHRILETRYAAEQDLRETQKQLESQILATQSQAEAQLAESTKQANDKAQEIEEKVLAAAEKVAGKVLEFTSHRHDKS